MDKVMGVVRALLTAAAGYAVGRGFIDQGTADQLIGAVIVIGTAIWSIKSKTAA